MPERILKPRFFGSIGMLVLIPGLLFTAALAIARLFYAVPLADRPALILGVLMIVLGIQIIALGLIGEIVIFAQRFRSQAQNRDDALARLEALIGQASHREKPRIATKPTHASRQRRRATKTKRGATKRLRGKPGMDD